MLDDEIARLRGLGKMTTARLDSDHFFKHGIERALQICVEVDLVDLNRASSILAFEALCGRRLVVRDPDAVATFSSRVARQYEDDLLHASHYGM